jgi:hypothetical protein
MVEDHCSSARPAYGPSRRRNDYGEETEGWDFTTQQEPEGAGEVSIEVRLPACRQEASWRLQACMAQGDAQLPLRNEIPSCSRQIPLLRRNARIAHGGTLDLRHIEVTLYDAGPLRIRLAGQSAEPDGVALEP